jgi:multidrug efflux pump subunit AcrA (membrane-fusion protein)
VRNVRTFAALHTPALRTPAIAAATAVAIVVVLLGAGRLLPSASAQTTGTKETRAPGAASPRSAVPPANGAAGGDARVTRGPLRQVLAISGRLSAARGEKIHVPVLDSWRTTVKWLAEEGAQVKEGDVVARLDTTTETSGLAEQETRLAEKRQERVLREKDGRRERLELEIKLSQARTEHEKTKIDAAVKAEMVGAREYQERQLALARAAKKREEAETALVTAKAKLDADLGRLDLEATGLSEQFRRDSETLEALTVRAGRAGVVLFGEHPWEGRKLRVGDSVQSTWPLVEIPDLGSLEIEAFVPESDAGLLRVGQKARVRLDAFPSIEFGADVREIAPRGEDRPQWGRAKYFRAVLALGRLDPDIMRPGMSVMAEVVVAELENALLVPLAATRWEKGTLRAYPRGKSPVDLHPLAHDEFRVAIEAGGALAENDALETGNAHR